MSFRVRIHPTAVRSINEAATWIAERAPDAVVRWIEGIDQAIQSLSLLPRRCGLAPENDELDIELRQYIYGRKAGRYRILFVVRNDTVHVIEVRHGSRGPIQLSNLKIPDE